MKKKVIPDVVPSSQKRSIRDIPIPEHRQRSRGDIQPEVRPLKKRSSATDRTPKENHLNPTHMHETEYQEEDVSHDSVVYEEEVYDTPSKSPRKGHKKEKPKKHSKVKFIIVGLIAIIVIFFAFRTSAEIGIYPKQDTYDVSSTISVESSSDLATKGQVNETATVELQATMEQQVEEKASGTIRISNAYSDTPQELVKNTRFQTEDGLVYRIQDSITIPGYTQSGGSMVPGTLDVQVFADSVGEEYNIGKTSFTVPGFKGLEQFESITAESVSNMTGGYVGIRKTLSEEAKDNAIENLRTELADKFATGFSQSDQYIIVFDTETIAYGDIKDEVAGNTVTLSLTASVEAYTFPKEELEDFIGQNTVPNAVDSDSFDLNLGNLYYKIEEGEIIVEGKTNIVSVTDIELLKTALAGKKRSEVGTILNSYSSFTKVDVTLKPFWKSQFPEETNKINIKILEE